MSLPNNPVRARLAAGQMGDQIRNQGALQNDMDNLVSKITRQRLDRGAEFFMQNGGSSPDIEDMHRRRQASSAGTSAQMAYPIQRDPFQYWQDRTQWFNPDDTDDDMSKLRSWCRLLYSTHSLVPSLIDIYTRFPLLEIEFQHKDERLADYHQSLFLDQLNYHEHLYDMGREHWVTGEVFSLGSWHDGIGAWEDDEIINPDDVVVSRSRIMRSNQFRVKVPTEIKNLIETQQPRAEYEALKNMFPDLIAWARKDGEVPVSDILMKQIKFKTDPWSRHGTPILLRAFRQLMLEESLNAAQDAVADRFYSPLILAKLGLDNVDDQGPWIPDPMELEQLRNDLNMALTSDMRLMVYHHGLDIQSVFGREQMPKLDADFDRIETKLMMVFGIGAELLKGGSSGAPYASGALNRELITQMLETYQNHVRRFLRERMEPIAERQGHYEYEKKGDRRIPIMERVLVVDEESGEEFVKERPKLAIPDVHFKAMNLRDEKVERDFLQRLKSEGFPVSDHSMAMNIPIDFDDELEKSNQERIDKLVAEQEFKHDLFTRLRSQGLPIPPDYVEEFNSWKKAQEEGTDAAAQNDVEGEDVPLGAGGDEGGGGGGGPAPDVPGLAEVPGFEEAMAGNPDESPDISDEMRGEDEMPKPAASRAVTADEGGEPAEYGERMKFGTPKEFKLRRKMILPHGTKISSQFDQFDEEEFERFADLHAAPPEPEEEEPGDEEDPEET